MFEENVPTIIDNIKMIFENTHEPIIDLDTWERVQELRKNKRRPTKTGKTNMFSGLAYCADADKRCIIAQQITLKADKTILYAQPLAKVRTNVQRISSEPLSLKKVCCSICGM